LFFGHFLPVHRAAIRGHTEVIANLIKVGVDVNVGDYEGYTALHFAAKCGHYDVCDLLYRSGADALKTNDLIFTPLDLAQRYKFDDIVALLSTPRHKLSGSSDRASDGVKALSSGNTKSVVAREKTLNEILNLKE
jgi:ankyrin repeat protein